MAYPGIFDSVWWFKFWSTNTNLYVGECRPLKSLNRKSKQKANG